MFYSDHKQRSGAGKRAASLGTFPEERPRQTRKAVLSYQEELELQVCYIIKLKGVLSDKVLAYD